MYISRRFVMNDSLEPTYEENKRDLKHKSRFSVAFLASVASHVLLVWLIQMTDTELPISEKKPPHIMDVVLLDETQTSKDKADNDAKTIANKNSTGRQLDANDNITRAARSPVTGKPKPKKDNSKPSQPKQVLTPSPKEASKKNAKFLATEKDDQPALLPKEVTPEEDVAAKAPPTPVMPLSNLFPSTSALAQLSRDFDREKRMKQMMTKEADIGINTREAKYAPYAQGLVRALEEQWRPGGEYLKQYSQNDRQVLMRVSIENNGALGDIKIMRASPSPELNESAIAAVNAAAPFKPLPSSWGLDRANFYFIFEVVEDGFVFRSM